ncbi:DUF397 domain-containing protein [Streptomyces niveus]|uniref:DUF397 domain-containing protein n=1 Tax=Streptomyces niveus TaxID=193462 RepID=UPI0035DE2F7D
MAKTVDALNGADWFKSSYSNDDNGMCLEGAQLPGGAMAVRDSKNPHGPAFTLTGAAWTAFIGALVGGQF